MKSALKKICGSVKGLRDSNAGKYGGAKLALLLIFPLLLVFICDLNNAGSPFKLASFYLHNLNILAYILLYEILFYAALLFLTRSASAAMLLNTLIVFTFSCVEFYKFEASGTHFVITDLVIMGDLSDLSSFTKIAVHPILAVDLLIMLAFIAALFLLNVKLKLRYWKSAVIGTLCAAALAASMTLPPVSVALAGAFGIKSEALGNSFVENDKFNKYNFLAYFIESASAQFVYAPKAPQGYSPAAVEALLPENSGEKPAPAEEPNVIFILSESYADFRALDGPEGDPSYASAYKNRDLMALEGYSGFCVVPTFGGYTVRSEFELMYGLPIRALNTPSMPNSKVNLNKPDPPAVPSYYKSLGYSTFYLHPFDPNFYRRDKVYPSYGFEQLHFRDWFEGATLYNGRYIDDKSLFSKIPGILNSSDGPCYIFATSMQNHEPFIEGDSSSVPGGEFSVYMKGIAATDAALGQLRETLLSVERPTILFFMGDHYPFLVTKDNKYDSLGINLDNCAMLYKQSYLAWSNRALDYSVLSSLPLVSAFYLPEYVTLLAGLPASPVMKSVGSRMAGVPVYSQVNQNAITRDPALDMLTYDIVMGKRYAVGDRAN